MNALKSILLPGVLFWFLALPFPAYADFDKGERAYNAGDYQTALREFTIEANRGDSDAQFYLGVMYYEGYGVPANNYEALKWYRLAADQGLADAQYNLGVMSEKGQGVSQDYAEAVRWFRLAAQQGLAEAEYALSESYFFGQGVNKNQTEGIRLLRLAADQGFPAAQVTFGRIYENKHPEVDSTQEGEINLSHYEAAKWYRKAAIQGDVDGQYFLANILANGDYLVQNQPESIKWFRTAAEQEDPRAQTELGKMYENGRGVPKNEAEAFKWYRLASAQNFAEAQFNLSWMYYLGMGTEKNSREGKRLAILAAENGYLFAQYELGSRYLWMSLGEEDDIYDPYDRVLGFMWLEIAASRGQEDAIEERGSFKNRLSANELAEARKLAQKWLENRK